MSIKICLDAGHYGKYNKSPANASYYESDIAWKLHLLLKSALEQYGITVITTRTSQAKDLALTSRGKKAKGCDLFLSLHSNAAGNKVQSSTDRCEIIYPISGKKKDLATKLAAAIKSTMGLGKGSKVYSRKGSSGDYYGVIRGATSVGVPGMILEHSFHDYKKGNSCPATWMLNSSNLSKLAEAEADTIARYFGVSKKASTSSNSSFCVQVIVDELNVRSGAGTSYGVVQTVKKNEVYTIIQTDGDWGRLKSGAGWINIGEEYCERV